MELSIEQKAQLREAHRYVCDTLTIATMTQIPLDVVETEFERLNTENRE